MSIHSGKEHGLLGWARCLLAALACCLPVFAAAHPANVPSAKAKVQADGTFELRVRFDLLAYVLDAAPYEVNDGPMNALLDGPVAELRSRLAETRERFQRSLKIIGDGGSGSIDSLSFPTVKDVQAWLATNLKPRLPVMQSAIIKGHLPAGSKTLAFSFPDSLGTVVLTTEMPYQEPVSEPVDPGTESTPVAIPTPAQVAQAAAAAHPRADSAIVSPPETRQKPLHPAAAAPASAPVQTLEQPAGPSLWATAAMQARAAERSILKIEEARAQAPRTAPKPVVATARLTTTPVVPQAPAAPVRQGGLPWYVAFGRYVKMGFLHIVPEGLDHILFVLGLFLLSTRTKDLLKQITAFTIAHSITLGLSLYGVFRLPASIVEPIIALSIAFVAIENLCTTELKAWRPYVVFLFGLVHGLGFATALQDAGLAKANFLTALVGFNSGVELGQLSVVAGAFLLVGWFRSSQKYRSYVTVPASAAIAAIAIIWTFERVF